MNATHIGSRVFGVLVVVAAVVLVAGWVLLATARGDGTADGTQPAWSADPARTNSGPVMFTLTPKGITDGRFRVDVRVNTHSGDLANLDLKADTVLRVGAQSLHPVKAPALRGHHAGGQLEFALERVPDAFEIVISGVRTQGDLTFRWP